MGIDQLSQRCPGSSDLLVTEGTVVQSNSFQSSSRLVADCGPGGGGLHTSKASQVEEQGGV